MCGIVGAIDKRNIDLYETIKRMRDTFVYRGPDGCGHFIDDVSRVALGHRRLTILDLSDAGSQPMHDSSGKIAIVYNGEVYNYLELRSDLEKKNYSFLSDTDTEVVINAYLEWGKSCLEHFNGMFSFAIWDKRDKSLFIARDRLGIKPLYYYSDESTFLFASEVKAILSAISDTPDLNDYLIDQYMSFGYIPGENTLHRGIYRLLPGHYILFKNGKLNIEKYWDITFDHSEDYGLDYYVENARKLLIDSIDLRLRSDVPLGIFLSGGLDSSAVVALLASRVDEPLKTYSVAYDFGEEYNETNFARQVATQFNTDHHEYIITPSEFRDFIPDYIRHMDEPVTEAAAISLYYIAKQAKKDVTVVLSGEGSDEIFAGYDYYYYNVMIEKIRMYLGESSISVVNKILDYIPGLEKIKKYTHLAQFPLDKRYSGISSYNEDMKKLLYQPDFLELVNNHRKDLDHFKKQLFSRTKNADALSRMLYFDTKTWLVDDLLIKADRMSMAPSLELRVPFLDYRLVEFAARMPSHYKLRGKTTKYLLKKMMKGLLPDNIINRKKMGFPTPLKHMFQGDLQDYAYDLLGSTNTCISNYFSFKEIRHLLDQHSSGSSDHHRVIWQLIVLETWLKNNNSFFRSDAA